MQQSFIIFCKCDCVTQCKLCVKIDLQRVVMVSRVQTGSEVFFFPFCVTLLPGTTVRAWRTMRTGLADNEYGPGGQRSWVTLVRTWRTTALGDNGTDLADNGTGLADNGLG